MFPQEISIQDIIVGQEKHKKVKKDKRWKNEYANARTPLILWEQGENIKKTTERCKTSLGKGGTLLKE